MIFLAMIVTFFGIYLSIIGYDILKELRKLNANLEDVDDRDM